MNPLAPLAFGAAAIGNLFRARTDAACEALIHSVLDAGIAHIDTAPLYGYGLSERRLGHALARRKDRPTLSTKVGVRLTPLAAGAERSSAPFIDPDPLQPHYDYSADGVRRSLGESLKRLGVDHIDIVLVHDLGVRTHGDEHAAHLKAALDGGFPALQTLQREGVIGAIGIGVNEFEIVDQLFGRAPLDVVLLAGRHTLLDRSAEQAGFFARCANRGVNVMLGGVFNSGLLVDSDAPNATLDYRPAKPQERAAAREWQKRANRAGLALPAAALAFARTTPGIWKVLIGPGDMAEWRQLQAWAATDALPAIFTERAHEN